MVRTYVAEVKPVLIEKRGPVKIVYFISKSKLIPSALKNLEMILEILKEKGYPYKVIEVDTIAGYHLRGIKKGKFIPLSTMHLARLLKRGKY